MKNNTYFKSCDRMVFAASGFVNFASTKTPKAWNDTGISKINIILLLLLAVLIAACVIICIIKRKRNSSKTNTSKQSSGAVTVSSTRIKSSALKNNNLSKKPAAAPDDNTISVICINGEYCGKELTCSEKMIFGRNSSVCNLPFVSRTSGISKIHCVIEQKDGQIILTDKSSTYGTFLGSGLRLTPGIPYILNTGDEFYLGSRNNLFVIK